MTKKLTPEEIGDLLDLESECEYPCSDGSVISTICVDKLLKAQIKKLQPSEDKPQGNYKEARGVLPYDGEQPEDTVRRLRDDVYDGLYREVVSREVAHNEGRPEGRSLVVELPEGGGEPDFISYGQRDMIDAFESRLDKDKVQHRGIEVGRFPAGDADEVGKVKDPEETKEVIRNLLKEMGEDAGSKTG